MMRNSWTRGTLGSLLRGTLACILLAGVFAAWMVPAAWAQGADVPYPSPVLWLKWRVNIGSAVEADSTYKMLNGAPATNNTFDTTAAFPAQNLMSQDIGALGPTASGVARVFVQSWSGTVASTDTLLVTIQGSTGSNAGGKWVTLKASTGILPVTANDGLLSTPILADSDALYDPYLFPFWRFIWRSDAASGATFPNARCGLSFNKRSSQP
jgi:hypothetical protein